MKHLTFIGAFFCLALSITNLILFCIMVEASYKELIFYKAMFFGLYIAFTILLQEYIRQCEDRAYRKGKDYCKSLYEIKQIK